MFTPQAQDITFYHTSNSCECMRVNVEALQLHPVYIKCRTFLLQVMQEPVSVLQVTWKSVSGKWNHYHHSTKLYWKKNCLLPLTLLLLLHTHNTDGNKLALFSNIRTVDREIFAVKIISQSRPTAKVIKVRRRGNLECGTFFSSILQDKDC